MSTTSSPTPHTKPLADGVPRELLASALFLLKRTGFAAKERSHEAFEETGLSPYHFAVLLILDEGTCAAQWMIADRLGYDRSQIVGLLDDLEERELVFRKRDPVDRRRHLVTLTEAGRSTLAELRQVSKSIEDEFLAPLSAEERRTLHDLLLKVASHYNARFAVKQ
jgi:DNA-binding MarR family transcriptional regulator